MVCVASNKPEARGLERGRCGRRRDRRLPGRRLPGPRGPRRRAGRLARVARRRAGGAGGLHGAARARPSSRAFAGRIVNVHPALLPAFPGLDAIEQALEHGVKVMGVTVHFVDEGVDSGPIILQEAFELPYPRAIEAIEERVHEIEHRLLPRAVRLIAAGAVRDRPRQPATRGGRWRRRLSASTRADRAGGGADPPGAPVGVRQARPGGLRARAGRPRHRDRLHRRHGARARRGRASRSGRSRTTRASPRSSTAGSRRSTRASTPACSRCARTRSTWPRSTRRRSSRSTSSA